MQVAGRHHRKTRREGDWGRPLPAAAAAGRGGKEIGGTPGRPPLLPEDEEGDEIGCRCRWPAAVGVGRGGKMRRGRRWDLDEMGHTGSRGNGVGRRRFGANGIG